jgi:hypothetical protein
MSEGEIKDEADRVAMVMEQYHQAKAARAAANADSGNCCDTNKSETHSPDVAAAQRQADLREQRYYVISDGPVLVATGGSPSGCEPAESVKLQDANMAPGGSAAQLPGGVAVRPGDGVSTIQTNTGRLDVVPARLAQEYRRSNPTVTQADAFSSRSPR